MAAKILVIEDDETIATLLDYNLKASGFTVEVAPTAEEGELILSEQLVDLVVLDWMLPDMSGIELCGRLRRTGKFPRVPIVMLTARSEEADRFRCRSLWRASKRCCAARLRTASATWLLLVILRSIARRIA